MLGLGIIGSILLGIAVISGLIKEGEMGCLGYLLIIILVVILIGGLGIGLLFSMGGML